jgi:hypothetical protein
MLQILSSVKVLLAENSLGTHHTLLGLIYMRQGDSHTITCTAPDIFTGLVATQGASQKLMPGNPCMIHATRLEW